MAVQDTLFEFLLDIETVFSNTFEGFKKPKNLTPFVAFVTTSTLLASITSLAILPILIFASLSSFAALGAVNVIEYLVDIGKTVKSLLKNSNGVAQNVNQRIIDSEKTLEQVTQSLKSMEEALEQVKQAGMPQTVAELKETLTETKALIKQTREEHLPKTTLGAQGLINDLQRKVNAISDPELKALVAELKLLLQTTKTTVDVTQRSVRTLTPEAINVLQSTNLSLDNANSAAQVVSTYTAPLRWISNRINGSSQNASERAPAHRDESQVRTEHSACQSPFTSDEDYDSDIFYDAKETFEKDEQEVTEVTPACGVKIK